MNEGKIKSFLDAFSDRGRFSDTCDCGRTFYREDGGNYDVEAEEMEELEKNATEVDHSIGVFSIDGKDFVEECDCWRKSNKVAEYILSIDTVAKSIARYLRNEKVRKQREADISPTVEDD